MCSHHKLFGKQALGVLYYNARSLLPKFDELSIIMNTLKPHIICIVESWLSSENSD